MKFLISKLVSLLAALLISLPVAAGQPIKKSESGICHSPSSRWYERTEHFDLYPSLEGCIASGGRFPKNGMHITGESTTNEPGMLNSGYRRTRFGRGWDDRDGDCRDSRAEALVASSTTRVRFASNRECRVVTGRWVSPFTGNVIQNSSDIDIDHVVPLRWAWEHGARGWTQGKREQFANDSTNLWPVEASLNRSKGARGPETWLPPSGGCQYVARFYRIAKIYNLVLSRHEKQMFRDFLSTCE